MNRLAGTLIVLGFVAAPPLAAAAWLHRHPWQTPTAGQIQLWANNPLTAGTLTAWLLLLVLCCWLLLVRYLIRRAVTGLRRWWRRLRRLPMPTAVQVTASSMAGIAAFTVPAVPPTPAAPVGPAATGAPPLPALPGPRTSLSGTGISLPGGGWIPYRTAAAVAALSALTWIHRRRHYQPDPTRPRDHHDDPDLQPLPDTVHTITTAIEDPAKCTPPQQLPPPDLLPDGRLRLTGPGAAAAARGLLITAALSVATGNASAARVTVRLEDLPVVMPDSHLADLITAGLTTINPGASPNAHSPNAEHRNGATELVVDPAGTTELLLTGDPAVTHCWHVTADGYATGTGLTASRRLCILDVHAATDLLTLALTRRSPDLNEVSPHNRTRLPTPGPVATAAAHLTLLGGCRLTIADETVSLSRTAGLQVLAYLAAHTDGATRTELTHAIWPHLPAATISQRFHSTLADLRKQLRPLLADEPVTRHGDTYLLNTAAISTDLRAWTATAQAVSDAVGAVAQQHACRDLVDQYRGELAAHESWPWLTPVREHIRRTVVHACSTLAHYAEPAEALTWLQRAITVDPYNEAVHHQAANLLRSTGDHAGAADLIKRFDERTDSTGNSPAPM